MLLTLSAHPRHHKAPVVEHHVVAIDWTWMAAGAGYDYRGPYSPDDCADLADKLHRPPWYVGDAAAGRVRQLRQFLREAVRGATVLGPGRKAFHVEACASPNHDANPKE